MINTTQKSIRMNQGCLITYFFFLLLKEHKKADYIFQKDDFLSEQKERTKVETLDTHILKHIPGSSLNSVSLLNVPVAESKVLTSGKATRIVGLAMLIMETLFSELGP
jgi:hypothetical protein